MALDPTEAQLLAQITAGDPGGLETLFRNHYADLCRFAYQKVRDWDVAEDVVQDVFARLWRLRTQLNISTSLRAYLFTATKNLSLNHLQQEKRHFELQQLFVEQVEFSAPEEPEDDTRLLELRIREAIETLPPKCKEVFELSRFEGMTYQEIADEMGIAKKTVENQMGKALSLLREQLAAYLLSLALFVMALLGG